MQATFPHLALFQEVRFHLAGQSLEPEESVNGTDTIVPTMRGRWIGVADFAMKGEAATLQWQAFLAQMQGRIGTTLVPCRSRYRPKDRNGLDLSFVKTGGISRSQTFEHFGFQNTAVNRIVLASAAALRATELDLTLNNTTGLRPGQFFSIGERLHRVQHHWEPSSGAHRVMIEPPLRAAASAGARLEIERPVCRMRMRAEDDGVIDQSKTYVPRAQITFMESL